MIAPSTSTVKQPGVAREKRDYFTMTDFHRKVHFDPRAASFQTDKDEDRIKEMFDVYKMEIKVS